MFWRYSATKWRITKHLLSVDEIGAKYREQLRSYLNDESGFPTSATIMIAVSGEEDLYPMVMWPSSVKVGIYFKHVFYIPGIEFRLFLGKMVPPELRSLGQPAEGKRPLFVEPFKTGPLFKWLRAEARSQGPI